MIAKVHIAPIEQWCKSAMKDLQRFPDAKRLVGLQVDIDTDSFDVLDHAGELERIRGWRVTDESWHRIGEIIGHEYGSPVAGNKMMCEHMLEIGD